MKPAVASRMGGTRSVIKGTASHRLAGLRVLLVEDEIVAAIEIGRVLSLYGCHVVATATDVDSARRAVTEGGFDVALLDINLSGTPSYPVADLLAERKMPFIIATAYTGLDLPLPLRAVPFLRKPFGAADLRQALEAVVG